MLKTSENGVFLCVKTDVQRLEFIGKNPKNVYDTKDSFERDLAV